MQETWKSVIGYEGIYEVSNNGKVRSVDRIGKRTFTRPIILKGIDEIKIWVESVEVPNGN